MERLIILILLFKYIIMSSDDFIIENNSEIIIDRILIGKKQVNDLINKKKHNHVSFFVNNDDYLSDNPDKNKVICISCTDTFFNVFFNGMKNENDEVMEEIFKSKVYMQYIPDEQVFRCSKCGKIELVRDPQIDSKKDKKILGAGIESFVEYQSYLDPDNLQSDFIVTANIGKKRSINSKKINGTFLSEETEEEKFMRYYNK